MTNGCACQTCSRHRRIQEAIDLSDAPSSTLVALIRELESPLDNTEVDLDYYRAICRGEWPESDEVLKAIRIGAKHEPLSTRPQDVQRGQGRSAAIR